MKQFPDTGALWEGFRDVDSHVDGDALMAHQQACAALKPVAESKRQSHELLELTPGDSVLDVGCGWGGDVRALAAIVGSGGRAVGVDASARAIAHARLEMSDGMEFAVADAADLPFADATFDACRTERALQHTEQPRQALREMARVTRPGGAIVATESTMRLIGAERLDAEITALVVRQLFPGDGWIGYFLPVLFQQAALGAPRLEHHCGQAGGWPSLRDALGLETVTQRLARGGAAPRERIAEWLHACETAAAAGTIEIEFNVMHVVGRR